MTDHSHKKIIAFVGLPGSGKTTAVSYLTSKGYPKISRADDVVSEITHLLNAGQHTIVLDNIESSDELRNIKHSFPGMLTTICLVTSHHIRHARRSGTMKTQPELDGDDWAVAGSSASSPMVLADYWVPNDASVQQLNDSIHSIISSL